MQTSTLVFVAGVAATLVLLAMVYGPGSESFEGIETYASPDDIAKVRALQYHLEPKHRSCDALKKMVAPIALANSCEVSDAAIADALPPTMSAQGRNNIAPLVKAQCRAFPGGVAGFLEAVDLCA